MDSKIKTPFQVQPIKQQNFFNKLLGSQQAINAIIEINNLFSTRDLIGITKNEVQEIANKYNLNLQNKFSKELEEFYREYLTYCLQKKYISDDDANYLLHLQNILDINPDVTNKMQVELASHIFENIADQIISSEHLDTELFESKRLDLRLSKDIAKDIYSKKTAEFLNKHLAKALSDGRFSPDEEKEIEQTANNLGITTLEYNDQTKMLIDKYRLYWNIENGEIPEVTIGINVQRNEKCYFSTAAKWHEYRRVTQRVRYGGPTFRMKIAKGFYWKMGDLGIQVVSSDILTLIDTGHLYLTNKRLIFQGIKKNSTIQISKILDFLPYKNGVEIQKESGKNPFIEFTVDIDLFSIILGRAIRDITA